MATLAALTLGFASGVFLRSIFVFGFALPLFALLLATILSTVPRLLAGQRRGYALSSLFLLLSACGMFRAMLADTQLPQAFALQLGREVSYQGIVVSDPDMRDKNQLVQVRTTMGSETTTILAIAPHYPAVTMGERVTLSGTLSKPEPFASENGRAFAYDKYLQKDGVRFEIARASLSVLAPAPWYSPAALFTKIKRTFLQGLDAVLPEPHASLAAGVVIGGESGLGKELQDAFVRSGLVQIIVLSGYNVMIVASGVMALLQRLHAPRKASVLIGGVALVFFVLVAGLSSTALRAMLMAIIALYARASARSYVAARALLAVVFLMLLWNPLLLVYDPGFDLSIAATAGLIWLAPLIELKLVRRTSDVPPGIRTSDVHIFWRTAFATTVAAQLAVWPLLLYESGNLSLVSIPANLLTMPVVPLAMVAAAIAGIAGMVLGPLAAVFALPAYLATSYIIAIAQIASGVPLATYVLPAFPFVFVLAAYAVLCYIAFTKRSSMTDQFTFSKKASI